MYLTSTGSSEEFAPLSGRDIMTAVELQDSCSLLTNRIQKTNWIFISAVTELCAAVRILILKSAH